MASIRRSIVVDAPAERVWEKLREAGQVVDLFPGVLTASRMEGASRVVTFANGMVVREYIVDIDDDGRRIVYAAVDAGFTHHNGAMQIVPETGTTSRFVWISDFLPDEARAGVEPLIDQGTASFAARWAR
ncbi:MAG: SRPBCC family protein [Sphingomonas sp.]|nr:SRPBCC family protein [Sphingomonas sp.]